MTQVMCGWRLEPYQVWKTIDDQISLQFIQQYQQWLVRPHGFVNHQLFRQAGCVEYLSTCFKFSGSLKEVVHIAHEIIGCDTHVCLNHVYSGWGLLGASEIPSATMAPGVILKRKFSSQQWYFVARSPAYLEYSNTVAALNNTTFASRTKALEALNQLVEPPTLVI